MSRPEPPPFRPNRDLIGHIEAGQQGPVPGPSQVEVSGERDWWRRDFHHLQERYNDLLALHTHAMEDLAEARAEIRRLRKLVDG